VWLSRHATVEELKQTLSARESFRLRQSRGWREASKAYFDLSLEALSVGQVALLASMTKRYPNPCHANWVDGSTKERNYILGELLKQKVISSEQFALALSEPVQMKCIKQDQEIENQW
jgi:membrane peptidoglycan carboxypeptidase